MMYAKLIFKNAKRSGKDYLIYIVTMTLCVTLFYAFLSISSTHYHPTIGAEYNISLLAGGMKLAICGISLLLLFLIHYVNRFMLRKKQSEFAVEATLGMEQKTNRTALFGETFSCSYSLCRWESFWGWSFLRSLRLCCLLLLGNPTLFLGLFFQIPCC